MPLTKKLTGALVPPLASTAFKALVALKRNLAGVNVWCASLRTPAPYNADSHGAGRSGQRRNYRAGLLAATTTLALVIASSACRAMSSRPRLRVSAAREVS